MKKMCDDALDKIKGVTAERPKVSPAYADIYVTAQNRNACWIEVKINHTDNLGNPRVFYDGKKWDTTYTKSAAFKAVELLNKSDETKRFLEAISGKIFWNKKSYKIPTTKGGLKDRDAVNHYRL